MAFTEAWRLLIDAHTRGDVTTPDRLGNLCAPDYLRITARITGGPLGMTPTERRQNAE